MIIKSVVDGLADAGINFVSIYPSSVLAPIQLEIQNDARFEAVATSNEGEAIGVCAGAWLGGKKPALLMENSGLGLVPYAVLRMNAAFGIPLLMVIDYRGEPGDGNWYMVPFGGATEPLLQALSIQYEIADSLDDVGAAVDRLYKSSLHAFYPTALLLRHRMLVDIK